MRWGWAAPRIEFLTASLYQDGICSTIGCVLADAMLVNALIVDRNPGVWYLDLDPAVALACGMSGLVVGMASHCRGGLEARIAQFYPLVVDCFPRRWHG